MCVCICVHMWAMVDPEILDTGKSDMQKEGRYKTCPVKKWDISNSLPSKYVNHQFLAILI